jgi:hypothetical protein
MGSVKQCIQIEVVAKTPFGIKPKTSAIKELAKLDTEVLTKLVELSKSKEAIKQLKTNFEMIKGFLTT